MAVTNAERIGKGLELLKQGLTPFVEREMRSVHGEAWASVALRTLRETHDFVDGKSELDVHALLLIMWGQWNEVFRRTLSHAERTYVSELREVRNRWAHQKAFSSDDTDRGLDTMVRLLNAVSAAPEAAEVERSKQELRRQVYEEQARRETRKVAAIEGAQRRPQTLARADHPAQGRGQGHLPAGRVRRRPLAGLCRGGGEQRVHGRGRVLPPHLPHRRA